MDPWTSALQIFKPNRQRTFAAPFKPVFERYAGGLEESEYNDLMATLDRQIKKFPDQTILADGPLEFRPNLDILRQIKQELPGMDLDHITSKDLILFSDPDLNQLYLNALNYVFQLAKRNGITSRKAQENFLCNMIVFSTYYLPKMRFSSEMANKVIHYGDLDERSVYFLILLYALGFDILSFNPKTDSSYWSVDLDHLSSRKSLKRILPEKSFETRAAQGIARSAYRTVTSMTSDYLGETLFGETGIFRPWSFRGKDNEALLLEAVPADILVSWNSDARLREGFEVDKKGKVILPHFFFQMEGVDQDMKDLYLRVLDSPEILSVNDQKNLFQPSLTRNDRLRLAFKMKPDGTFDPEKLRSMENYPLARLSAETETVLINKLNEVIKKAPAIFGHSLSKEEKIDLAASVLQMAPSLIKLIDNFDYPFRVPKVVIFLENEDSLQDQTLYLLAVLNQLGLDLAVFSPAGQSLLSRKIKPGNFSNFRAEKMDYHSRADQFLKQSEPEKPSFSKMFSDFFKNL